MEEKEIAEIIFQVYRTIKKSEKISAEKETPSNWLMSERLKMFDES